MYLTKANIQSYSRQRLSQKSFQEYVAGNVPGPGKSHVFVSHSHIDVQDLSKDEIRALIILLMELCGNVYIDWLDPDMPSETSEETAKRLQEKIDTCDRFLLVATNNAVKVSRWVPWELGYADKSRGISNIAVLPIADPNGQWEGSEYLRLYPQLLITNDDRLAVFPASATKGGRILGSWADQGL